MDLLTEEFINPIVKSAVESVTGAYLARVKTEFFKKLDQLQKALKANVHIDTETIFLQKIQELYRQISKTALAKIECPVVEFDCDYNSNYRFYSERECEKAADKRRERAYREARNIIEHSSLALQENCAKALAKALEEWKQMLLTAYDVAGKPYPKKQPRLMTFTFSGGSLSRAQLEIKIGAGVAWVGVNPSQEIKVPEDSEIERYVTSEILRYGTSVGDAKLKNEYEYCYDINHDCDLKEGLFGNYREVNHRYAYHFFDIYEIRKDTSTVVEACTKELQSSSFWKSYFENIKKSFIAEVVKLTEIAP